MVRNNGEAMAAFVAASIGTFSMGLFVILNEAGIFAAPALHAGAGGVSGRTTLAIVVWLVAWAVLHRRWRARQMTPAGPFGAAIALILIGLVGLFPPVWSLL
jgi:hypothetical protein